MITNSKLDCLSDTKNVIVSNYINGFQIILILYSILIIYKKTEPAIKLKIVS